MMRERPSRVCPDWPLGSQSGLHKRGQAASHLKADRRLVGKASVAVKPQADEGKRSAAFHKRPAKRLTVRNIRSASRPPKGRDLPTVTYDMRKPRHTATAAHGFSLSANAKISQRQNKTLRARAIYRVCA